jgi:hypothetical protein
LKTLSIDFFAALLKRLDAILYIIIGIVFYFVFGFVIVISGIYATYYLFIQLFGNILSSLITLDWKALLLFVGASILHYYFIRIYLRFIIVIFQAISDGKIISDYKPFF